MTSKAHLHILASVNNAVIINTSVSNAEPGSADMSMIYFLWIYTWKWDCWVQILTTIRDGHVFISSLKMRKLRHRKDMMCPRSHTWKKRELVRST